MAYTKSVISAVSLIAMVLNAGCNSSAQEASEVIVGSEALSGKDSLTVRADVWVDNWFMLSVNGQTVLEDSTPFNTERSFNGDSGVFEIKLPATVALEFRDFYENDTGLEYIGSKRQQMGDGGGVAQMVDVATGQALFVTDESLRCKVIHRAPLDKSCARERNPVLGQGACHAQILPKPEGWMDADFDDSGWSAPTIHSARAVRPRSDYEKVNWDSGVKFIWGQDLEIDNIVLCRATIEG